LKKPSLFSWRDVYILAAKLLYDFNPTRDSSRSGFKIPDWAQGQGVRPIGKAQHTWVCEHLPEAVLHHIP
jgi:hypothetical protein